MGPVLHPQAVREARADALREALEDEAGLDPQIDDIDAVERAIAASVEATGDGGRNESPKLATDWSVHLDDGEPDEYGDDVVRVRLSTLAKYLKTPFQTAAQYRAGLRDEDDDPQRYEPFEAGSLDTAIVTRSVYESVLRDGFPADINSFEERKTYLKNQYEKEVRRRTASGDWPIEVFGAQTRKRHKSILEGWEENRAKRYPDCISPPDPGSMTVFEFGPGPEEKSIAPIELDLRDHSNVHSNFVELFGKTHLATREERNLWELVSKNTNSDKGRLRRYSLEAYIEHLALITEGFGGSRKFVCLWGEAYSNGPGKLKSVRVSFDNIGVGEARRTLKGIVCDYLEGAFHKLAPWGCVRAVWDGEYEDMEEAIDDNNDRWNTPACEYGPVENWEDYPVLDNEEISGIVNRRFKHHPRFKEQN
ncbi:MAG: hypothetical protein ABEL76_12000 [Bradymonadaceae bacterium]